MSSTKSLMKIDQELNALAEEAAHQEANTGGGNFISIQGGSLQVNGSPVPDDEMVVIILDSILVNAFYLGKFNPDDKAPPVCYAMGRDEGTLKPHEQAADPQHDQCGQSGAAGCCPRNEFGSGEGRGKACKNTRRLAVIGAGSIDNGRFKPFTDLEMFSKGERYYLNVPPTSIQGYGAYVKQLKGALGLPPVGVFTKIRLVKDQQTLMKLTFQALNPVPKNLLATLVTRHKAEREVIAFPWPKAEEGARKPGKGQRRPIATARSRRPKF